MFLLFISPWLYNGNGLYLTLYFHIIVIFLVKKDFLTACYAEFVSGLYLCVFYFIILCTYFKKTEKQFNKNNCKIFNIFQYDN